MQFTNVGFNYSPLLLVVCAIVACGYGYILYLNNKNKNYLLFSVRALLVFILTFLFLEPFAYFINNEFEKPTIALLIDNSASIPLAKGEKYSTDVTEKITAMNEALNNKGFQVRTLSLDPMSDSLVFDYESTPLTSLLDRCARQYEVSNFAGAILFSDGIVNSGISPEYKNYKFPIQTIGLGDIQPRKDIKISNLAYNKIVRKGNKFTVRISVTAQGVLNQASVLSVKKGNETIKEIPFTVKSTDFFQEYELVLPEEKEGLHTYNFSLKKIDGEINTDNNQRTVYLEVIDDYINIALIAAAPHPDIKMLRAIIEKNDQYKVNVFYADQLNNVIPSDYQLAILHQLPSYNTPLQLIEKITKSDLPIVWMLGRHVDQRKFNALVSDFKLPVINQQDEVTGKLSTDFKLFKLEEYKQEVMDDFPPLEVPYGQVSIATNAQILLSQQVGRVNTEKPLIVYANNDDKKSAYILGEGYWKWRMYNYLKVNNTAMIDELFSKIIALTHTTDKKKRLEAITVKEQFIEQESVKFRVRTFDELYEPLYDQAVKLSIKDEQGNVKDFEVKTVQNMSSVDVGKQKPGLYTYVANTMIAGKKHEEKGKYMVEKLYLEASNLTADFALLQRISNKSNSIFIPFDELKSVDQIVSLIEYKELIHSTQNKQLLINWKWLFFVLVILITAEWIARKMLGSY